MTFDEYQQEARKTAIYPGQGTAMGLAYIGLGLGEAGEIQNKIKKILRDSNGVIDYQTKVEIAKEGADLLWYLANLFWECGVSMSEMAQQNIDKLRSRQERGVLKGSGDNR